MVLWRGDGTRGVAPRLRGRLRAVHYDTHLHSIDSILAALLYQESEQWCWVFHIGAVPADRELWNNMGARPNRTLVDSDTPETIPGQMEAHPHPRMHHEHEHARIGNVGSGSAASVACCQRGSTWNTPRILLALHSLLALPLHHLVRLLRVPKKIRRRVRESPEGVQRNQARMLESRRLRCDTGCWGGTLDHVSTRLRDHGGVRFTQCRRLPQCVRILRSRRAPQHDPLVRGDRHNLRRVLRGGVFGAHRSASCPHPQSRHDMGRRWSDSRGR